MYLQPEERSQHKECSHFSPRAASDVPPDAARSLVFSSVLSGMQRARLLETKTYLFLHTLGKVVV